MGLTDYNTMMPMNNLRANTKPAEGPKFEHGAKQATKSGFDMTTEDFMTLIMAQFQNQDIMNPASTDDFLNQMIQMMTIQTMTNMNDISTISYAASLVGKEVTIGVPGKEGLEEIVGVVTGTGMMNGQQIIIVNGKEYGLNQILAIGKLPENPPPDELDPDMGVKPESPENPEKPEKPEKPEGGEQKPDGVEGADGQTTESGKTETAPEDSGQSGTESSETA
ncbi:MAG: flagellar hook capping FlgD N-terminal domain-containing protein [Butyricicoccus sp.]